MSKYLGKLVLERGFVDETVSGIYKVLVKYCVSSKRFLFKCFYRVGSVGSGDIFSRFSFYVSEELCWKLVSLENDKEKLNFQYVWSVGYAVREKRQDVLSLHNEEMNVLGGRKELILNNDIDSDYNFDVLCAIQYKFCLSPSVLSDVIKAWKRKNWGRKEDRWVELKARDTSHFGRKVGSKNVRGKIGVLSAYVSEAEREDELERVRHNKKVAVLRGYLGWWVDACKEECEILGVIFDKEECLDQWKKSRDTEEN